MVEVNQLMSLGVRIPGITCQKIKEEIAETIIIDDESD